MCCRQRAENGVPRLVRKSSAARKSNSKPGNLIRSVGALGAQSACSEGNWAGPTRE